MKFRLLAQLASLVAVFGIAACSEDPTDPGDGVPEAIATSRSEIHQTLGGKFTLIAFTLDKNTKRIPGVLDANSAGSAVVVDSVRYAAELAETRIFLNAAAASEDGTTVTVSGQGLTKDVTVIVTE